MGPIRKSFKNESLSLFTNLNRSENSNQDLHPTRSNVIDKQRSTSKTQRTQSTINDIRPANDEDNDCFVQFGFVSSSEEKHQRMHKRNEKQQIQTDENENEHQDQPAHLVEEIDAITALILYNTYSRKHAFTFSAQHRARTITSPRNLRDDIDRFDALYSCLIEQTTSARNNHSNLLSDYLRNRFFALSNVHELKAFQENEQARIREEKLAKFNRVPFIPNILSYQRTCPHYDLEEMQWIRERLC